jgi:hypothetical protein
MSSMAEQRASRYALVVSVLAHASLLTAMGALAPRALAAHSPPPSAPRVDGAPAGDTFDVEGITGEEGSAIDVPATSGDQGETVRASSPPDGVEAAPPPPPPATAEPAPPPPPTRAPRKHRPPPPAAASAAATAAPGSSAFPAGDDNPDGDGNGAGNASGDGKRLGPKTGRDGSRLVARTFAHEVPDAVRDDKRWSALPAGTVGVIEVPVTIDADGKVLDIGDDPKASDDLRSVVNRTRYKLGSKLALTAAPGTRGVETLRITVTLSDGAALPQGKDFAWGIRPDGAPTLDQPATVWFTLPSGRHFEAVIAIVSSRATP